MPHSTVDQRYLMMEGFSDHNKANFTAAPKSLVPGSAIAEAIMQTHPPLFNTSQQHYGVAGHEEYCWEAPGTQSRYDFYFQQGQTPIAGFGSEQVYGGGRWGQAGWSHQRDRGYTEGGRPFGGEYWSWETAPFSYGSNVYPAASTQNWQYPEQYSGSYEGRYEGQYRGQYQGSYQGQYGGQYQNHYQEQQAYAPHPYSTPEYAAQRFSFGASLAGPTKSRSSVGDAQTPSQRSVYHGQQLNATAPTFQPTLPKKSVSAATLYGQYRIDKTNRYSKPKPSRQPKFAVDQDKPCWADAVTAGARKNAINKEKPGLGYVSPKTRSFDIPLRPSTRQRDPIAFVLPRPQPKLEYVMQALQDPQTRSTKQTLLIVLDLNGTLLHRTQKGGSNFIARPNVAEFLQYLLQNHKVVVWSSARPDNVQNMCDKLLTPAEKKQLVAVWARDKLGLSSSAYNQRVQVYKQLSWLWADKRIQSSHPNSQGVWNQSNTVLIDDSYEKAASEPHSIIEIEEFEGRKDQMEADVLGQVIEYLEKLRTQHDVSAYIRQTPFAYEEIPPHPPERAVVDLTLDDEKSEDATHQKEYVDLTQEKEKEYVDLTHL